eukprot:2448414-Amphidinium_carterae.1
MLLWHHPSVLAGAIFSRGAWAVKKQCVLPLGLNGKPLSGMQQENPGEPKVGVATATLTTCRPYTRGT